jgi:hypothetical protein
MKYKCKKKKGTDFHKTKREMPSNLGEHPFSRNWCLYEVQMRLLFGEK